MPTKIEKVFRSPYAVPNGLQVTDDGLWIVDQITDRVALVEITADADYTVPKLIRDIPSESSNTSGMAYGGGALWLAANGPGERWRSVRDTDAKPGTGEIFKVDPATGETLGRYPIPDGGGTHGVEYDNYDEGHLWVQTLKNQVTHKVRISDWSVQKTLPCLMDADTVWFALKMDFGQLTLLIGLSSNLTLKTAHRLIGLRCLKIALNPTAYPSTATISSIAMPPPGG